LHNRTEFDVWIFVEGDGRIASKTWTLAPDLELVKIHKAEEIGYVKDDYDRRATPVLEIKNTGTGPTRLQELVALDINNSVPLADKDDTTVSFARAVLAYETGEDGVAAAETHEKGDFFIPEGFSAFLALDGYLTHSGADPEQIDSAEQTFDIELRWLFDTIRYDITAELQDGIIRANGKNGFRFQNYEITQLDNANPAE
jgi:hypothetical protein